ncbi:thymidine phosphorylase [Candidatus Palauibacter irciniicola]|uniref:thymidine phosphorylase n=1 Tax=Candidatus Palauibacter irciniicola TaxID=3056733 RepID=UPI003B02CA9F
MLPTRIIEKKRDGGRLSSDELAAFLRAYLEGSVAEYQMSAFLMAAFIRGLDPAELSVLLREIIDSGARLRFADDGPPAVDKHSTGGVGDKVSLILAPLLAEAGLRVPMMSGRGLGHTGGTLDKLEAIPGFNVSVDLARFQAILDEIGCAMIGQTKEIAPLDGRLYALRDVTGTVPSPALIAASIVSKKVAEGIGALVLDVKCGRGAFITDRDQARGLARTMVDLATAEGVRTSALLTAMDAPLGRTVGNALEVREAIETLRGGGPADLREVTLALSAELLVSVGHAADAEEAAAELGAILDGGAALERFARLIEVQGGDPGVADDPGRLPAAPIREPFPSPGSGWLDVDARTVGVASVELGAGRRRVEDAVDPRVGFEFHRRAGDRVSEGEPLLTVHAADAAGAATAAHRLTDAIRISPEPPASQPLILERIVG